MSYLVGELSASITGDTRGFDRALDTVRSAGETAARDISRRFADLGGTFQSVGKRLSLGLTAPITAAGYAVARMGGDFQSSMNRVQALTSAAGDQLEALRDQAKELGIETQFSASEAADAMGFLAMAGFDANQILGTLPDTLNLAAASGMDLAQTADTMSNIMQGYGLQTHEAARASDVLTKAFTSSNTDLGQLAEAMKYAGPVAAGMGVEFEEAAAAIGLMGNAGIQGSMAGTSLRNALSRLARPTGEVRAAMERLGLSVQDLSPTTASLTEIVERLQASGASTSDMLTIFGQRAGPAMQALIDQGADSLRGFTGTLREAGGEASRVASVQMQGFEGSMKALRSAIQGVAIEIAEAGVLDFLEQMARRAAGLVRVVANLNPVLLRAGAVIGGLAAATGPLLLGLGALTKALPVIAAGAKVVAGALALLASPIALAVAGIAGLVAAGVYLYRNFESVREITHEAWGAVAAVVSDVAAAISDEVRSLVAAITQWWSDFGPGIIEYTRRTFENVLSVISIVLNTIGGTIRTFLALIRGDWSGAWSVMQETGEAVWSALRRIIINTVDTILAAFQRLVGWLPKIGESFAASIGDARAAVQSLRPAADEAAESMRIVSDEVGSAAESASEGTSSLDRLSAALGLTGERASEAAGRFEAMREAAERAFAAQGWMRRQGQDLVPTSLPTGEIRQLAGDYELLRMQVAATDEQVTTSALRMGLYMSQVGAAVRENVAAAFERLTDTVLSGVTDMMFGFASFRETLRDFGRMVRGIVADLVQAIAKTAILRSLSMAFGGGGGFFGSVFSLLGGGRSFASGGIVSRPMPAIVGDNPQSAEAIVPLHALEGFIQRSMSKVIPNHALSAGRSGPIDVRIRGEFVQRGGDLVATIDTVRRVQGY